MTPESHNCSAFRVEGNKKGLSDIQSARAAVRATVWLTPPSQNLQDFCSSGAAVPAQHFSSYS